MPTHAARCRAIPTKRRARGSAPRARARERAQRARHGALGRAERQELPAAPRAAPASACSLARPPRDAAGGGRRGVVVGERVRGERGVELGARAARAPERPRARRAGSQGTARARRRARRPAAPGTRTGAAAPGRSRARAARRAARCAGCARSRGSAELRVVGEARKPRATSAQKAADVNAAWSSSPTRCTPCRTRGCTRRGPTLPPAARAASATTWLGKFSGRSCACQRLDPTAHQMAAPAPRPAARPGGTRGSRSAGRAARGCVSVAATGAGGDPRRGAWVRCSRIREKNPRRRKARRERRRVCGTRCEGEQREGEGGGGRGRASSAAHARYR